MQWARYVQPYITINARAGIPTCIWLYSSIYVPAMTVQQGYLGSKLLRVFPDNISKEIQAEPTAYNYTIQISFDTEETRKKWVAVHNTK